MESEKSLRLLYAVQGTGNGHVARAREIIPILQKYARVDVLLSGTQSQVDLPLEPKFRLKGISMIYNGRGGLDLRATAAYNRPWRIWRELRSLPLQDYDLVINDFEAISAWACRWEGQYCVSLGHQFAFRSPHSPRPPRRIRVAELVLRYFAPGKTGVGFHFMPYDNFIFSPVIRREIRQAIPQDEGFYTVYLPAFGDEELAAALKNFPSIQFEVFSRHCQQLHRQGNLLFRPVNNQHFIHSFTRCRGIICSAGFETPAEALFMGKKLLCIPIAAQYEQSCNAAALRALGVVVITSLKPVNFRAVEEWLSSDESIKIPYPDQTEEIIRRHLLGAFGVS